MRYTTLGRRGPRVSVVAIGSWQAGGRLWGHTRLEEFKAAIAEAVSLGVNLFDTAELYGLGRAEKLLGEALREAGALESSIIVTKVAGYRVTLRGFIRAVEASSRRLGRRPDVVLYHWPPPIPFTVCRVAWLLEELVERGLTSWIGYSNFNAGQLEKAVQCSRKYEPIVLQIHYNLAYRTPENKLMPTARRYGLGVMAWSPLAKGALAGKRSADNMARRTDKVFARAARDEALQNALEDAAKKLGVSKAVVALAWLIAREAIPVVGVRRLEHVRDAVKAADTRLPRDIMEELDSASSKYISVWGRCYSQLHRNRYLPPPIQAFVYRVILRGI